MTTTSEHCSVGLQRPIATPVACSSWRTRWPRSLQQVAASTRWRRLCWRWSPSTHVRFHRFWSIAELAAPGTPLAAVAHDAGYSDHAHLVRDCRAITGAPPGRFLAESFATFPDMSDPYKTGPRFTATLAS